MLDDQLQLQRPHFANVEPSRTRLVDRLRQIQSFHDRHGLEFSILHARLENHDSIGTRFETFCVDSTMYHVERTLAPEVRVEDTIGRTANTVFSIILMATPAIGARRLRERLRRALALNPMLFSGRIIPVQVDFSIQCPAATEGHGPEADSAIGSGAAGRAGRRHAPGRSHRALKGHASAECFIRI